MSDWHALVTFQETIHFCVRHFLGSVCQSVKTFYRCRVVVCSRLQADVVTLKMSRVVTLIFGPCQSDIFYGTVGIRTKLSEI